MWSQRFNCRFKSCLDCGGESGVTSSKSWLRMQVGQRRPFFARLSRRCTVLPAQSGSKHLSFKYIWIQGQEIIGTEHVALLSWECRVQAVQIFAIMNVLMAKLCLYTFYFLFFGHGLWAYESLPVCVCVCETERMRKRERGGFRVFASRKSSTYSHYNQDHSCAAHIFCIALSLSFYLLFILLSLSVMLIVWPSLPS